MHALKTIIRQGWSETKDKIPESLAPYFSFRDELTIHDGLVFKGERLVISLRARPYIKSRLHASHVGIQGSLRRARESVYWPGMNQEVSDYRSKCTVCANHPRDQAKAPLITHDVPSRSGQRSPATFLKRIRRTILLL